MIITGKNLRLLLRNRKRGYFENYKEIENEKIGFNLEHGQRIYSITYIGRLCNQYIKYHCLIKEINNDYIIFTTWNGEKLVYPWKLEGTDLAIEPCERLHEKYNIKKLIQGEVKDKQKWYKHGGFRSCSEYENNLSNFIVLGQQALI